MQKVIPMKSKAYRASAVNQIHLDRRLLQRHQALVHAGQRRRWPRPLVLPSAAEQEMAYQVDWLEGQSGKRSGGTGGCKRW
jgi:hypothetical protein